MALSLSLGNIWSKLVHMFLWCRHVDLRWSAGEDGGSIDLSSEEIDLWLFPAPRSGDCGAAAYQSATELLPQAPSPLLIMGLA